MSEIVLWSLTGVGLAFAVAAVIAHLAKKRHEHLQAQGYELIYALKAYAAWVDCRSEDESLNAEGASESELPEPLDRACALKDAAFQDLSQYMVRLLQAHGRLIEYLRNQNLSRLSQASDWRPIWQDPQYQQIRGALEDLIQEMIGLCQEMVGDRAREWRRTGTDFCFSGSASLSTTPGPANRA